MIIPERYKDSKFEDVPQNVKILVDEMFKTRKGIYIYGSVGSGKTHIAYAIRKYVSEERKPKFESYFYNMSRLLYDIKQGFDASKKVSSFEVENIFNLKGILFIDDLGAERLTDWVQDTIYGIVNDRYEKMYPVIFTSNLNPQQLADRVGDRVASRIVGMCNLIEITGDDKRLKQ